MPISDCKLGEKDGTGFVGYGKTPPRVEWPEKARIAVSIVVNYEEGSEHSLAFGDPIQEGYKEYPKLMPEGVRDLTNESVYEYGTRVGFWRIMRILKKYNIHASLMPVPLLWNVTWRPQGQSLRRTDMRLYPMGTGG